VKVALVRPLVALALLCVPSPLQADVSLAGRLVSPVSGAELSDGAQTPSLSPDGRYLAFVSTSANLGLPSNGSLNLYVCDLTSGECALATSVLGEAGNSFAPSLSEGALAVAFQSDANNFVPGGTSGVSDLFYSVAYDAGQGQVGYATYLVSKGLSAAPPNGASEGASLSADGRWVAFRSYASNLIAGDTNGSPDIFVGDAANLFADPPERVSVSSSGGEIDGYSMALSSSSISSDGRYVAFSANPSFSIDGSDPNTLTDVFVRDREAGTTSLISKSTAGEAGHSSSDMAAISPSGRFVVFRSFSNLVASPSGSRVYLRDRQEGTTIDMPLPPNASSCEDPRVSDFADIVAQCSLFTGSSQVFLYTPRDGSLYMLSTSLSSGPGNGNSGDYAGISANGAVLVFDSAATDLVPSDMNSSPDVFLVVPEPGSAAGAFATLAALATVARRTKRAG